MGTRTKGSFPKASEPTEVHGTAYCFTAPNAGPMTLEGTNSYVIGREQAYVIDPGPDDEGHLSSLFNWINTTRRTVSAILLTHGHPDHALGATSLARRLDVPIQAIDSVPYPLYVAVDHVSLRHDAVLGVDGGMLRVVATPGHTPDSVSYFLDPPGMAFTGDTILGRGSSVVAPPEGDMTSYVASLEVLHRLHPRWIAPGHGPVVDDAEGKIREYIEHRRQREIELLHALTEMPCSTPSLVAHLYAETPRDLHPLAAGSVLAGLAKLEREGKVRRDGEMWSPVSSRQ